MKWRDEAQNCFDNRLTTRVYYGGSRVSLEELISRDAPDIVVTTYGLVASEFTKYEKNSNDAPILYSVHWWRVCLDEAHFVSVTI